jgi:plastocyanin
MQRREFLWGSGSLAVALPLSAGPAFAGPVAEITMTGRTDGSKVWFAPYGLLIQPGQTVRWINKDKSNSHTATAYAPANDDHPRRIPEGAKPFDSDYLLFDETFEVTLTKPGVYDYYCIPHELSGMVGRIVVAEPGQTDFAPYPDDGLDQVILDGFPSVADIVAQKALYYEEG